MYIQKSPPNKPPLCIDCTPTLRHRKFGENVLGVFQFYQMLHHWN